MGEAFKLPGSPGYANAPAATARRRLDHHRKPDFVCGFRGPALVCEHSATSRKSGNTRALSVETGSCLVPHQSNRGAGRADKGKAGSHDPVRKCRILGQKPVARVNGVGACPDRRCHERLCTQIRSRGQSGANFHGFVGHADRQHFGIRCGICLHGPNSEIAGGTVDPHRDLPAVGDEEL